jgi:hypothetical protein
MPPEGHRKYNPTNTTGRIAGKSALLITSSAYYFVKPTYNSGFFADIPTPIAAIPSAFLPAEPG